MDILDIGTQILKVVAIIAGVLGAIWILNDFEKSLRGSIRELDDRISKIEDKLGID
jgi:hypothetical protein